MVEQLPSDEGLLVTNPVEYFYRHETDAPEAAAIVSARTSLTYKQVKRLSQQCAQKFSGWGIRSGQVVGLHCQPEISAIFSLALLQLGATSLTAQKAVTDNFGQHIDVLITDEPLAVFTHKNIFQIGPEFFETLEGVTPLTDVSPLTADALVRIVFSSGTTGVPKGVPFDVRTLLARIDSARTNWMPVQPFMSLLGPETVTGFQTMFAQFFSGNTYFLATDAAAVWMIIRNHGVRSLKTSPARLGDVIRYLDELTPDELLNLQLEVIEVAGSLLSPAIAAACYEKFGIWPTYLYGSTEVGTITRGVFNPDMASCVGTLITEVECEIVDEAGNPVTAHTVGSIRMRRHPMAAGYWKAAKNSQNTGFIDSWFYPGDTGYLTENQELILDGRTDDRVNAGGVKVNLAQLDVALARIEEFSDVATFQFTNDLDEALLGLAYVSEELVPKSEVERIVRLTLPGMKFDTVIRLDFLPRNSLGKVERKKLVGEIKRILNA